MKLSAAIESQSNIYSCSLLFYSLFLFLTFSVNILLCIFVMSCPCPDLASKEGPVWLWQYSMLAWSQFFLSSINVVLLSFPPILQCSQQWSKTSPTVLLFAWSFYLFSPLSLLSFVSSSLSWCPLRLLSLFALVGLLACVLFSPAALSTWSSLAADIKHFLFMLEQSSCNMMSHSPVIEAVFVGIGCNVFGQIWSTWKQNSDNNIVVVYQ